MGESRTFVSYSHDDAAIVGPVVRLLRVQNPAIFQDVDSIRPGKKWRQEIEVAITRSRLLIVFWCHHAQESDEVEAEWRTAIRLRKDLLPVLLDDTPLTDELAEFQWIDFQALVAASHRSADEPPKPLASKSSSHWAYLLAGAAAVLAVGIGVSLTLFWPESTPGPVTGGPQPVSANFEVSSVVVILAVVLALWAVYRWRARRLKIVTREAAPAAPASPAPAAGSETVSDTRSAPPLVESETASQMAQQIESEVLRRIG